MLFETQIIYRIIFQNFKSFLNFNEQIRGQNRSQENRMSESDSHSLDMSSDKNLISKCFSKNSDSFDDRIWDDLSEEVLQFLPLEHKLSLESVSKQFQRTLFQKQFSISLYSSLQSNDKIRKDYLESIQSLLKKCKKIQTMSLILKNRTIFKSILPLIIEYCRHLNEFNVSLKRYRTRTKSELKEEFYLKFGSKMKYLWFDRCSRIYFSYEWFPNLSSIGKKTHHKRVSPERLLETNLMNLKEVNIKLSEQNHHLFLEVLQKYYRTRHLTLVPSHPVIEEPVFKAFKESPVLQNLIELKYRDWAVTKNNRCNKNLDSLTLLSEKFPKLKSLEFGWIFVKDLSVLRQQLSSLKAFSELQRLHLWGLFVGDDSTQFSFKPFEELSNITHLKIVFWGKDMDHKILTDIEIYLPKLQYLLIDYLMITDEEGDKQIAESLSRLSSLRTIELCLRYQHISESLKPKIIEKCRKIQKISISIYE